MKFEKIEPINGNLLVQDEPQEKQTETGIYIPESASPDQIIFGTILDVSKPWTTDKGDKRAIDDLKPGDKVLYSFHAGAGNAWEDEQKTYRMLKYVEILAKLS
jgi:co-chaperonin GroES (HSP10)